MNALGKRLLLVEDHPDLAHLMGMVLWRNGWEVVVAKTMLDARAGIKSQRFHIILLDLRLPDSTPSETVAAIPEFLQHAAVIVTSSMDDQVDLSQIQAAGALYANKESPHGPISNLLLVLNDWLLKHP